MSFVWGDDNVNFLRARYTALQQSTLFRGMRYSEDHAQIKEWAPLVMEGRDPKQKVAATRTEIGTDVNYGKSRVSWWHRCRKNRTLRCN